MLTSYRILNLALAMILIVIGATFFRIANLGDVEQLMGRRAHLADSDRDKSLSVKRLRIRNWPGSPSTYDVISDRDLFNPDRVGRDVEDEEEEEEIPTEEIEVPESLELSGTVIGSSGRFALFSDPSIADGRGRRYGEGDDILDFIVKEIRQDLVILMDEYEREVVVKLYDPDSKAKRRQRQARPGRRTGAMRARELARGRQPDRAGRDQLNARQKFLNARRARQARQGGAGNQINRGRSPNRRARDGGPLPFIPAQMK